MELMNMVEKAHFSDYFRDEPFLPSYPRNNKNNGIVKDEDKKTERMNKDKADAWNEMKEYVSNLRSTNNSKKIKEADQIEFFVDISESLLRR